MTVELRRGIFQFPAEKPGSHVYLIKGSSKNVLIDTGLATMVLPARAEHMRTPSLPAFLAIYPQAYCALSSS